jgi:hypothetical protein
LNKSSDAYYKDVCIILGQVCGHVTRFFIYRSLLTILVDKCILPYEDKKKFDSNKKKIAEYYKAAFKGDEKKVKQAEILRNDFQRRVLEEYYLMAPGYLTKVDTEILKQIHDES